VGVTGYRIKRDGTELDTVNGSTTTYTDTGLQQGTNTYTWTVEARDAAGNWSTAITGQQPSGQNPLNFVGAYLTTATSGSNTSDTGASVEDNTSVPVRPTIKFEFERSVTQDTIWTNNKTCFTMKDSSGSSVAINVFRISNGTEVNSEERRNIFITPLSDLTPGKTYEITISKNLVANNTHTLGEAYDNKDIVVSFNVAPPGGSPITTKGPAYTNGSGTVDQDGATVGLGEMAKVVIPADALNGTASVKVTVKKVTSPPAVPTGFKVFGDVYEFSVGDKTSYSFAKNVALTFKFEASKIGADEVPAIFYYDETQKQWVNIGGTVSSSTITVQVNHFTKYTVFAVKKTVAPVEQPTVPVEQPKVALNDIAGHWAQGNIEKLVSLGAVSGYPDGSFKPGKTISRAEFASMLVKAFKLTASSGKSFTDTTGHWAKDAIATAAACGVVNGYDVDTFGPNDLITREQIAAMIVNAAKLSPATGELQFADSGSVSEWAKKSVITAVKNGIMNGYPDNKFLPRGNATRAEAVTVIVNALK